MASTWAKRVGWGVGGAVVAVAAYLAAWPVPIQPVAWSAPAAPGYQGVHAPNQRLAKLQMIDLKGEVGPEHIAFGKDGKPSGVGARGFGKSPGKGSVKGAGAGGQPDPMKTSYGYIGQDSLQRRRERDAARDKMPQKGRKTGRSGGR